MGDDGGDKKEKKGMFALDEPTKKTLKAEAEKIKLALPVLKPIVLTDEWDEQSPEAKELASLLVRPAIFERLAHTVPRYPLLEVEEPFDEEEPSSALYICLQSLTRWWYFMYTRLALGAYPFAVFVKEFIRFWGFVLYYFWAVPCRYINVFLCGPFLDGIYRCYRPIMVFLVILTRPVVLIITEYSAAYWSCLKRAREKA